MVESFAWQLGTELGKVLAIDYRLKDQSRPANWYRAQLERFRYGPGVFKMDWALSGPIPWLDPATSRAGTVHLGGPMREIVASEDAPSHGRMVVSLHPIQVHAVKSIPRELLYIADEVFFTGTACEVTPIRSVDRIDIGNAGRGEITANIQKMFFEITSGERQPPGPWLTYVRDQKALAADEPKASSADNGRRPEGTNSEGRVSATVETKLVARAHSAAAD